MDVWQAIRTKRAVRSYQERPLPEDVVRRILDAGRLSQSSKNLQPWTFVAVQDRERLRRLAAEGGFSPHLGDAALGVIILTPDPNERFQTLFDAGQAASYMQLAAWELGVGSCPLTSYGWDGVRAILGVPDEWHVRHAIAFGYPELSGERPRRPGPGRRPFEDVVRWETWAGEA